MKLIDIDSLNPSTYNPRTADPRRLDLIELSLRKLGFLLPIYATPDGEIISGHQRHHVAKRLGVRQVPVEFTRAMDLEERKGVNVAFNRATNDLRPKDTPENITDALARVDVKAIAAAIPDKTPDTPEFYPCLKAQVMPIAPLLKANKGRWITYATSISKTLYLKGVLLPPVWHIGLLEAENFTKMAVLSLVAVIASALAARIRKMAREALQRERVLSGVYALSQDMLGIANVADMRQAAQTKLASLLATKVNIILKDEKERGNDASRFCLEQNTPTGNGTKHFSHENALYLPLSNHSGGIGVMVVSAPLSNQQFSSKILATLAAQTASALEKATLSEAHEKNLRNIEREKFLSALLSSVSHDFKTPLVTVIGAFSSLKDMTAIKDNYDCREMVAGGLEEAQKLNRFINNLVEISRLESGLEAIHKQPVHLRDILASALKSLHPLIAKQRFSISADSKFPLLNVNSPLMELVFLNLLENAIKYGPPEGEVKIIARNHGDSATIDIDDDGEGIPESEREAIFVKFYRSKHGDRKIAGTGLGLYICRGIIEAHGGTITAIDPHDGKGACVRLALPKEALIPIDIEEEIEEV